MGHLFSCFWVKKAGIHQTPLKVMLILLILILINCLVGLYQQTRRGPSQNVLDLFKLSDASHSLHIIDLNCAEHTRITLRKGLFHHRPIMRQPERVTKNFEGNSYLVGEPNQFFLVLTPLAP